MSKPEPNAEQETAHQEEPVLRSPFRSLRRLQPSLLMDPDGKKTVAGPKVPPDWARAIAPLAVAPTRACVVLPHS